MKINYIKEITLIAHKLVMDKGLGYIEAIKEAEKNLKKESYYYGKR